MNERCIVFDFGGVVGGTDKSLVAEEIARQLHIPNDEATILVDKMYQAKKAGISNAQFWKEQGILVPENWDERLDEIKRQAIRARPEMLQLVQSLRSNGYTVAMLSNVSAPRAQFIREAGIYSLFDPVVLSCEIHASKPEQKAFSIFLALAKKTAEQCVFIDNTIENITTAKSMGFEVILFESPEQLKTELKKKEIVF